MRMLLSEMSESGEGEDMSETSYDCWVMGVVKQAFGKLWKEILARYVDF